MGPARFLSMVALTVAGATLGCTLPTAVIYSPINSPPRAFARRDPARVDVFVGKPPARSYLDVGLFEVYQGTNEGTGTATEWMITTLRLHAALRGCDAVQILGIELVGKTRQRVVRGVCEMYTDPPAQIAATQTAAPKLLPGESKVCEASPPPSPPACPDPLVCSSNVCASPYR